jgi:hypothetical protein
VIPIALAFACGFVMGPAAIFGVLFALAWAEGKKYRGGE